MNWPLLTRILNLTLMHLFLTVYFLSTNYCDASLSALSMVKFCRWVNIGLVLNTQSNVLNNQNITELQVFIGENTVNSLNPACVGFWVHRTMDSTEKVFHIDLFVLCSSSGTPDAGRGTCVRPQSTRLVNSCHPLASGSLSSCSKVSFWSLLVTLQVSLPDPESSESLADSSDSSSEDCFSPKRSLSVSGIGLRSKEQLSWGLSAALSGFFSKASALLASYSKMQNMQNMQNCRICIICKKNCAEYAQYP